jgi:hypothetical protein
MDQVYGIALIQPPGWVVVLRKSTAGETISNLEIAAGPFDREDLAQDFAHALNLSRSARIRQEKARSTFDGSTPPELD